MCIFLFFYFLCAYPCVPHFKNTSAEYIREQKRLPLKPTNKIQKKKETNQIHWPNQWLILLALACKSPTKSVANAWFNE